jgi:hypothetical protein
VPGGPKFAFLQAATTLISRKTGLWPVPNAFVSNSARLPAPGDLAIISLLDETACTAKTVFRRWQQPHLIPSNPLDPFKVINN